MFKPARGSLKYPFITPGSHSYNGQLWDWDSWLSDVALRQILLENGDQKDKDEALQYERGCVLIFLDFSENGGWIPIMVNAGSKPKDYNVFPIMVNARSKPDNYDVFAHNMHKPCLAQHAAFLTKLNGGDAKWLREKFPALEQFVDGYYNHYRSAATGLYFWQTDEAIGVDNDPCTFFRPAASSGAILLNCLMYKELKAMVYLATQLDKKNVADKYQKMADDLLDSIRKNCWDPKDGFYYSVDLDLRAVPAPATNGVFQWHMGAPRDWNCLIQRVGVWSGFLAMWAGVATPEQAKEMVERNFRDTKTFNAPYGVRSLSKMEKMYNGARASSNPSNWLGPIWINANYLTFRGLVEYGYNDDAKELAKKTIVLLGKDFEENGLLHEYYVPESGQPVMNPGFQNWNYLVLNMIAWYEGKPYIEEF
jgi:putative isomerase